MGLGLIIGDWIKSLWILVIGFVGWFFGLGWILFLAWLGFGFDD